MDVQNNIFNIDELFDKLGRFIMLIPTESKNNGHWVCFLTHGVNTIEYFDPYAFPLNSIHKTLGAMSECNPNWFKETIKKSGYRLTENKKIFQDRKDSNNNTCGRWCVLRISFHKLSNNEFIKYMAQIKNKYKIKPEDLVILSTSE